MLISQFYITRACENVSSRAKSARLLDYLQETFSKVWLKSRQLALILKFYEQYGTLDRTEHFGTYRVDLVVSLFSRLLDVHNFEVVLNVLTPKEIGCVFARIGMLHVFNPMKPEGAFELDLSIWEERQVVKALIILAVQEPGANWTSYQFRWDDRKTSLIQGWVLTNDWLSDAGVPKRGILAVR
jgi:hypothetical protein